MEGERTGKRLIFTAAAVLLALPLALTSVGCIVAPPDNGSSGPVKVTLSDGGAGTAGGTVGGGDETSGELTFGVGETAEYRDVRVTLVGVSENMGSEFIHPDEGGVYLVCEFEIENISDKDVTISSVMSFDAYVDDYSVSTNISALMKSGKTSPDGTVAPGKKMNGVIGYEVSENWSEIEIRFAADLWSSKKMIFVAKHSDVGKTAP